MILLTVVCFANKKQNKMDKNNLIKLIISNLNQINVLLYAKRGYVFRWQIVCIFTSFKFKELKSALKFGRNSHRDGAEHR